MTSKLRVKLGRMELEFEGSEEFIKQELMTVLTQFKTLGVTANALDEGDDSGRGASIAADESKTGKPIDGTITTSTIAAKLKVSSGPDLVIAALARLCLVAGGARASRKQLVSEMKGATAYYRESYRSNLSAALKTLITSQRVNDLGSNHYSLSATERASLEKQLAEAS